MATVTLTTGAVGVELVSHFKPVVVLPQAKEAPGGLYPLMSSAWEMDEYRIMNGWPVEVPRYDVRAQTLVTAVGEVLTGRDDPAQLVTGAFLRYISDSTYYDEAVMTWKPIAGPAGSVWQSSTDYAPVLIDDYEYRVGDERFTMDALNFDSDTQNHMWQDFTTVLGGAGGYTVIMVMSPNSMYGNDTDVPYNGLWCPSGSPDGWQSVVIQGNYLYLETESSAPQMGVPCAPTLNSTAPSFVALCFGRPQTVLYVGTGPNNIVSKSLVTGTSMGMQNEVFLGRSQADVLHTADMALFDLGIYADILSPAQVKEEFTILSRVYGGDK